MAFVLETGFGVPSANAYAPTSFVDSYLADRGRSTEGSWQSTAPATKQARVILATSYIDIHWGQRVGGWRLRAMADGRESQGALTLTVLPVINQTVTVGLNVYRFVDVLALANDVIRGTTITTSAANLASAVTSGGDSTTSHVNTIENYEVSATAALGVVTFTAAAVGTNGNEIPLATTVGSATVSGAKMTGGLDAGPQGLVFPRQGLVGWDGQPVVGIPVKLKMVTAEFSVRVTTTSKLAPDLTSDATGARVQSKREKVGPIEEATDYAQGAVVSLFKDYPEADRLMLEYLNAGGRVTR